MTADFPKHSLVERRRFLQGALATGGAALALPSVFSDQLGAAVGGNNNILVTVTLAGGNDGLNSIGPFADGRYRDLRGNLAIPVGGSHTAGHGQYFHPQLRRLATRYRRGDVAVVQGAGDPGLDRSHFSNLARWQSGIASGGISRTGWVGRWLDSAGAGPFAGVAIGGRGVPLHFRGNDAAVTDLPHNAGALFGSDRSERRDRIMFNTIDRMARSDRAWPWVDAVADVNALAVETAANVAPAYNQALPDDDLHSDLLLSARLINLNLGVRVLNVWQSGYDTHDDQISGSAIQGDHANLLSSLDTGLDAFFSELSPSMASNVVVMIYSEFGRRAEANGSNGTDHGTASNVVLVGRSVTGGMYGETPNLRRLDDRGDLRVDMDFRRIYATVLDQWLAGDPDAVLGGSYNNVSFFTPPPPPGSGDLVDRAAEIRDRRSQQQSDYLEYHSPRF